ncbi:MAG: phage major tail protein, TP901-1 family [Methylobacteriaceae bacterium]|nr:phage major tail protein, TP901-1 family [Methylobacteriaceae bacterium]
MAAFGAKDILVRPYVGGVPTTLTGLRTKQIKINNEAVDVTNADSIERWRELLTGVGTRSVEVTGSGVPLASAIEKTTLNTVMAGGALATDLVVPNVGTFTGTFVFASFQYSGEHKGEAVYDVMLQSSGPVTLA